MPFPLGAEPCSGCSGKHWGSERRKGQAAGTLPLHQAQLALAWSHWAAEQVAHTQEKERDAGSGQGHGVCRAEVNLFALFQDRKTLVGKVSVT